MSATETVTQTAATTPAAVEKVETPSPVVEDISNRIFLGNLPPKVSQEDITKFLEDFTVERIVIPKSRTRPNMKKRGTVFAFVSLSSKEEAEKAVETMNEKVIEERPITVKVANPIAPAAEKTEEKEKTPKKSSSKSRKLASAAKKESESSDSTSAEEPKEGAPAATSAPKKKSSKPRAKREPLPEDISPEDTIFVSNIPFSTTKEELVEYFKELDPSWAFVISTLRRNKSNDRTIKFIYGFVKFSDTETQEKAIADFNEKTFGGRKIRVVPARERKPKVTGVTEAEVFEAIEATKPTETATTEAEVKA